MAQPMQPCWALDASQLAGNQDSSFRLCTVTGFGYIS